jgi:hypothetical protein
MLSGGPVRGYPLFQTVLMFLCFTAAGYPVWRLTRPAPAPAPLVSKPAPPPAAASTLEIEADFAPAPADFEVRCLDAVVIEGHGSPGTQFKKSWTANVPKEGVDLVFRAHWPAAAAPSAARLIVQSPGGSKVEKSFWTPAGAALEEVVTAPGQ